jgi:hypothetical protein
MNTSTSLSPAEKYGWLLVAVLAASVAGVVVWKLWPLLFPQASLMVLADPACDLNSGPCSAEFPGNGRLELSLSPRPLAVLQPLRIKARIQGLHVNRAEVDFSGVDMYMGYNRPALIPDKDGAFTGQAVLPVCSREDMPWEARVLLSTPQGLYAASFRFQAGKGD